MSQSNFLSPTTNGKEFTYASFRLHEKGLTPIGTPSFDEWASCGRFLKNAEISVHFWLGDWLNYGEKQWGEKYQEALTLTGFDYSTLRNDKWVASSIDVSRRRDNLSFEHHKEVALLDPERQEALWERADKEGLTREELRREKHRLDWEALRAPGTHSDPRILLGDCTKLLETLPDNSVDLLLTDPPYGLDYQSEHREVKAFPKMANDAPEKAFETLDKALSLASQKLKENSHAYIFTSWKTYPQVQAIVSRYLTIKNLLIWAKNNWTPGDLAANFAHQYEMIIFCHKGRRHLFGSRGTNILHFDRVPENALQHPTEKPVELLSYLIEKSTQEGEVVLDPFMGSGSTCLAAKNMKRTYTGIEIDEQWYNVAQKRLT